jgi:hypothetical protein
MEFNATKFNREKWNPASHDEPVPELAAWFQDSDGKSIDNPVWSLRALNGEELAVVQESAFRARNAEGVIAALCAGAAKEVAGAIKELLGYENGARELAKRIDLIKLGSVAPKPDRPTVVKLFQLYPEVAFRLSNKVMELTGVGHQPGK